MDGLNDRLRQMQRRWRYAVLHRRTLIVDIGGHSMLAPFGRYFEPRRANASFSLTLETEQPARYMVSGSSRCSA